MSQAFAEFTEQHRGAISLVLQSFFDQKKVEAKQLSPHLVHSIEQLEKSVLSGGKAIRPLLVILGYLLAGGIIDQESKKFHQIYSIAAATELVHKYLLVLDDIADRDEVRNGEPTLWKRYEDEFAKKKWHTPEHHGRTFAEIDSALLASFVSELLISSSDEKIPAESVLEILRVINHNMYFETVAGWQIQYFLNHVPLAEATEEDFLKGLELVTAKYTFVAPLKIGAIAAEKKDSHFIQAIETYGLHVGTAFQIQDDILGLFGDPKEMGKAVGNDVREGKKTLLLQQAYRQANEEDKTFLAGACGRNLSNEELQHVQEIVKNTGSLKYSQMLAKQEVEKGLTALNELSDSNEVHALKELAQYVIRREK
jgi:geranylgeranyl diphosphate synthase type I